MGDSAVTLITGGSSGTGGAAARLLLGKGQRVAVTGRDVSTVTVRPVGAAPIRT
jgi:NADP-dependent 3-hydroxy acid dehydrogenase YdfG